MNPNITEYKVEQLTPAELREEAQRLEALLRAGDATASDGERLSDCRIALRKLGKARSV